MAHKFLYAWKITNLRAQYSFAVLLQSRYTPEWGLVVFFLNYHFSRHGAVMQITKRITDQVFRSDVWVAREKNSSYGVVEGGREGG